MRDVIVFTVSFILGWIGTDLVCMAFRSKDAPKHRVTDWIVYKIKNRGRK
jgi:hypothetical protein